ncbi:prepilin peptidase [Corynebacterium sp. NML 120412]|uniref:prepilin peptidase n=1 Tax=Corynebacterium sp. NML 120412 TaxID=2029401 RepID=UPI000BAA8690|nr:A24 family peptidase [Corynebacterium sp. NML 120412]PAT15108.1 prepilin peptidase [Corynebacterium sp. NML 120412]
MGIGGALFSAEFALFGPAGVTWLALCTFVGWSIVLARIDARHSRLPNGLTVPPALVALAACVASPYLAWGLVWPAAYLAGPGMGGGDVKLAVPLGVLLAALGGPFAVLAAVGLAGLLTVVRGWMAGRAALPHGPQMLAAAWAVGTFVGLKSSIAAAL